MATPPFPDSAQRLRVKRECTASHLRRATNAVARIHDQTLAPSGLRGSQFSVLVALSLFGEVPLLRLAEELGLDRTTLTRNLKPLERDGLVSSGPARDQRVRLLRLTDKGRRALQKAYPLWEEAQRIVVASLGHRRWTDLLEGLGAAARIGPKR